MTRKPVRRAAGRTLCVPCGAVTRQISGHTLIELMIVAAIVVILMLLAQPGFQQMLDKQRIDVATRDLFGSIMLTRAEAIRRGHRVDLVASDGIDWRNGWTIFVDADEVVPASQPKKIIHVHASLPPRLAITSVLRDRSSPYIAYTGNGRSRINSNSQVPQVGHLQLTLGAQQRRIILNFVGRPRLCNPAVDSGCE